MHQISIEAAKMQMIRIIKNRKNEKLHFHEMYSPFDHLII